MSDYWKRLEEALLKDSKSVNVPPDVYLDKRVKHWAEYEEHGWVRYDKAERQVVITRRDEVLDVLLACSEVVPIERRRK